MLWVHTLAGLSLPSVEAKMSTSSLLSKACERKLISPGASFISFPQQDTLMLVFFSALVMVSPSMASPGLPIRVPNTGPILARVRRGGCAGGGDIPRPQLLLSSLRPSIPLDGKRQVWQNDVIPILVKLLSDPEEEVQANAAGALMHAMVTTEGKARGALWVPEAGRVQAGGTSELP